jgi:transcriptional regulator with XRE-family HTH domain
MHDETPTSALSSSDPFAGLGDALVLLRRQRGLKQYQIAEGTGLTKGMISSYESGRMRPSLETLGRILGHLDCDLGDLSSALKSARG